jgi:hypothetical protein
MKIKTSIKKISFTGFILSCAFSISCSTFSSSNALSVNIPHDYLGIVDGKGKPEEYELLDEMGAVWLLRTFYWGRIEREKDKFDFAGYDNFVDSAKSNGQKVIAVLAYAVKWINDGRNNDYISNGNIHHFLNYIEILVNRYKGKVDAWQIWNEPNWIFWKGTNKEFYELSRLAAQKIREMDPDAYIIGGGFLRHPKNYIKNMNKSGAFENLDALSFHPYAVNPNGSMRLTDNFIKTLSEINFKGDIWITEVGFPTSGIYPSRVSLKNLPSYVIKIIAGTAVRGARAMIWYDFADLYIEGEYPNKYNSEMYFGLTYSDLSRKNGAWAYELCARYLSGSLYAPELPVRENINSNIVSLCFIGEETKTNTLIIWNNKKSRQKIRITLSSPITIHEISTGNHSSLSNEAIFEVSDQPIFLTWQGDSIPHISK